MKAIPAPEPTPRELAILKVLWEREEATVRQVYEELRKELPIVQNTVQAFLRIMEDKGLVTHRQEGRTFVYSAVPQRAETERNLVSDVLERVFDGALDQLVENALTVRRPTPAELDRLRRMIDEAEQRGRKRGRSKP